MTLFDIRVTTTVNWLGAPRCLRQMKRCSEQEETTSIAKRSIVLGCSISIVSAFGETSFIARLVLSPKRQAFLGPLYYATMFLREAPRINIRKLISRKQTKI